MSKDCTFRNVTAQQYREELVRDSFINGLSSAVIRQRLLENDELCVDRAFELADNLDRAYQQAVSLNTSQTPSAGYQAATAIPLEKSTLTKQSSEKFKDKSEERWEDVLPESLHAIRSLVCLATNETPHDRMFKFNRRSMTGVSMHAWLLKEGPVYLRKFIRNKSDPFCERVYLLDANPSYVRLSNGNETTVSTSDLAPVPENAYFENENNLLISSPDATPPALLTNGETFKMPSVVVDQTDGTLLTAEADLNNLPTPSADKTIDVDAVQPSVVIPRRSERIRRHPERLQAEKLGEWVKQLYKSNSLQCTFSLTLL